MATFKIVMPKLGESIQEGTITRWMVKEGDTVEEDDMLFEVATDKVDSEIPSPVDGVVKKLVHPEGSLVPVGETVALIQVAAEEGEPDDQEDEQTDEQEPEKQKSDEQGSDAEGAVVSDESEASVDEDESVTSRESGAAGEVTKEKGVPLRELSNRFYSPVVRTIAREEMISAGELETIEGTGANGRVQKRDILKFLEERKQPDTGKDPSAAADAAPKKAVPPVVAGDGDKVVEMGRVRKLIADHMVMSKQVSPHVTAVVEADVTDLVFWRERIKGDFQERYDEKITFMPFFIEAVAAALAEFPMVNSSVADDKIILRKNINIGIAVAKPDGNLIVPVLRNAEQKNLVGLTKELNRLAVAARNNKLLPDEIQGGTFTITNFGTFRNLIGTPIINQPQVAILATGSIVKVPAVIETPTGDAIAIRHKMFLSLSYDHRVVDGALGGAFLRRIADILEQFDVNRAI